MFKKTNTLLVGLLLSVGSVHADSTVTEISVPLLNEGDILEYTGSFSVNGLSLDTIDCQLKIERVNSSGDLMRYDLAIADDAQCVLGTELTDRMDGEPFGALTLNHRSGVSNALTVYPKEFDAVGLNFGGIVESDTVDSSEQLHYRVFFYRPHDGSASQDNVTVSIGDSRENDRLEALSVTIHRQ